MAIGSGAFRGCRRQRHHLLYRSLLGTEGWVLCAYELDKRLQTFNRLLIFLERTQALYSINLIQRIS